MTTPSTTAERFGRGLVLKCPRCGSPGILQNWFRMRERCPRCNLALNRGEHPDFWLGAYAINLVVSEGFAAVAGLTVLWLAWPRHVAAQVTAMVLAVVMPIAFYPFSRALWLAWDLTFRPSEEGD
jgi:uncharacterized protein (DUF983 family)